MILMSFKRSVFPLIMLNADLGRLSSFERNRINSSFALPFSGAAFIRIL